MVKATFKRYYDELEILDGIIVSVIFSLFMVYNWKHLISNSYLYLFAVSLFIMFIIFLTFLTIKDIFKNIDEIQISVALFVGMIFLFMNQFFLGILVFYVTSIYCFLFLCIFARNLILKSFKKKACISW